MTASSVCFLIFIYVIVKLLVQNGLPDMFLLIKNIENINSFVSRGLTTLLLSTYIRHILVCSILITSIFSAYQNLILIQVFLVMTTV